MCTVTALDTRLEWRRKLAWGEWRNRKDTVLRALWSRAPVAMQKRRRRRATPESEVKRTTSKSSSRKSWPVAAGEGSPPRAEGGASPVNAYWWTRKVLAENEVDLDDDDDLADGKSRVVFTSVESC